MSQLTSFAELFAQLNSRQRQAVDRESLDGPVMVIAGPGTGKTKILTLRIANILLSTDTAPESILALTFTESGATEMRSRLAAIADVTQAAYRVNITTFHSFCNSIIQNYPDAFGLLAGSVSMVEADLLVLVQELLTTTPGIEKLCPESRQDTYLRAAMGSINTLKMEGVSPERLSQLATAKEASILSSDDLENESGPYKGKVKGKYVEALSTTDKLKELAILYRAYQDALRERRAYDYNDMVMEVARAFEQDESLLRRVQEQYQYILVDEHQDTNNAQNKVIELLASYWDRPNLFIVGDAKQAIYRFQGASLENFSYFHRKYPNVTVIQLDHNYRSSQFILDAAQGIRASDGDGLRALAGHDDAPISVVSLSTPEAQYFTVAQSIRNRLQDGVKPEEIAVVYRDNADGLALAEFLDKLGVPYGMSLQADAFADPYLHQLILILDVLRQFGEAAPLYRLLHAPVLGVDPLDLYKLMEFCRKGRNPFDVMRSPGTMHEAGIDDQARLGQLAAQLGAWSRMAAQPQAAEAMEAVVRESGVLAAIVADANAPDSLEKLHALYDMLKAHIRRTRTLTLADFATHLEFLRSRGIPATAGTGGMLPGRVRLMTAHKSKGLEFDIVYIIDCVDGHWGGRTRRQLIKLPKSVFLKATPSAEADEDDDDRNLFYVALTRARREVMITMSQRTADGKDELPARYIADIRETLIARPDTAEMESAWASSSTLRFETPIATTPRTADKEYLNELFVHQGLSVTALNNYLLCPWHYFYKNMLRIPEAPAFAPTLGNAIDHALTEYFNRLVDGTRGTREDLVGLFEAYIRHESLQEKELQKALARGRTALEGYYDLYHTSWHGNVINQLRIPAITLADGVTINGKLDKVELLGATGEVLVVDYKTGKPKSRGQIAGTVKDGDGNYLRQLTFYKLLLDRWQDGKYRMLNGVIDFIEPDARGKYHRELFAIPREAVHELEREIIRVADEILTLAFWDKRCDDRDCKYCKLRDKCLLAIYN
jgi:DNA helicase-2/ATP-dependent DNA helicase PcrA